MSTNETNNNQKVDVRQRTLTIIGIVLCVILVPILIVNCTLIIKSFINKDEVPDFAGVVPLIVLSDSMYPDIKKGDLIFTKVVDANNLQEGDVISFYAAEDDYTTIWTHKIIEVIKEGDTVKYRTQGINNPTADGKLREVDKIIGKYSGTRFGGAGNVAMAMQKPGGLIVCVVVPILLFVGYDIIRRRMYDKNKTSDVDALRAELEALKAERAAQQTPDQTPVETPAETPIEAPVEAPVEVAPEAEPEIAPQEDTTPEPQKEE